MAATMFTGIQNAVVPAEAPLPFNLATLPEH